MPTKRLKGTKKRAMTKKNSRVRNSPIVSKTSNIIYSKLRSSGVSCLNGCKGFGAYFFIEYLVKLRKIKRSEFDTYLHELLNIEINMSSKITSDHMYKLIKFDLPVYFLSRMSSIEFDEITKDNILYCSIFKKVDGMVMPIHTFILSNGDTVYNSWISDTTIPCSEIDIYNSEYAHHEGDEDSIQCVRKIATMSPKKINVDDAFGKLKKLITGPNHLSLITSIFGLDESNIIGIGNKSNANMNTHRRIVSSDSDKIVSDFYGSEILIVKV